MDKLQNLFNIIKDKKRIVAVIAIVILLLSLALMSLLIYQSNLKSSVLPKPSPTPIQPTIDNSPFITSTDPTNGSINIPLDQKIIITFNRSVTPQEIAFSIDPAIKYSQELQENQLFITPQVPLSPGVRYTYIVRYPRSQKLPLTYSFTTTGPTAAFLPDTQPSGAAEESEKYQKENQPDLFLSNKTPYEAEDFSVVYDFTDQPTEHFYFTVTLKGTDNLRGKNAFISWMKSLGLTDGQIATLDIIYQNQ